MVSDDRIQELVKRIVEEVHPIKVILFGSTARGEDREDSDIDVLVVMPDGTHRLDAMTRIYRALIGSKLPADIVVATASDMRVYADSSGLIYREALKDGVELYAA